MERAKAVDRVRKFLAYAERTTTPGHERDAMRRQAQQLIAKHGIAEHETRVTPPRAPQPVRAPGPWGTLDELLVALIDLLDEQQEKARKNKRRRRG